MIDNLLDIKIFKSYVLIKDNFQDYKNEKTNLYNFLENLFVFLVRLQHTSPELTFLIQDIANIDKLKNEVYIYYLKCVNDLNNINLKFYLKEDFFTSAESLVIDILKRLNFLNEVVLKINDVYDFENISLHDCKTFDLCLDLEKKFFRMRLDATFYCINEKVFLYGASEFYFKNWKAFYLSNFLDNNNHEEIHDVVEIDYFETNSENKTIKIAGSQDQGWVGYNFVDPEIEGYMSNPDIFGTFGWTKQLIY